jgi:sugar lactone lactonase YvrE
MARRFVVADAGHARALFAAVLVLAVLSSFDTSAQGATPSASYAYTATIGAGDSYVQAPQDSGVAVGQGTGNVFLTMQNAGFVQYYDSSGTSLGQADVYDNTSPNLFGQNLAVDPTTDELYVNDSLNGGGLVRLVSDGQPTPTYTVDSGFAFQGLLASPGGMAVDPTTHDLLVADRGAGQVLRVDTSDGSVISTLGGFQSPGAVAVGPTGNIYVLDLGSGSVERFLSNGTPQGAFTLPAGSTPRTLTVNPVTGDVAVVDIRNGQSVIDGFSATGTSKFSSAVPSSVDPIPQGQDVHGIAWNGTLDRIYVTPGNNSALMFVPAVRPGVDPPSATPGRNTMHVSADIAPGGSSTSAWFEYCLATAACDSFPVGVTGPANPWKRGPSHDGLTSDDTIVDDLPLYSNATWKIRAVADNTLLSNSAQVTVNSPLLVPGVETRGAGSVTEFSAEVAGVIDPIGDPTTYHFEYGLTSNYGSRIPVSSELAAGNNRQPRTVSRTITGLQSGTTYHYRLVAKNSAGEAVGADRTFTTAGPVTVAPGRSYEQVSPVEQHGALVNGTTNFWMAADGSWAVTGTGAAEAGGASSQLWQHYISRRSDSGWSNWIQLDPPRSIDVLTTEGSVAAVSDDGTHALVISNRVLAQGGVAGAGNMYIYDVDDGSYAFVGSSSASNAYQLMVGIQAIGKIFVWGTSDFSSVVFRAAPPMLPGVTGAQIYRWNRGQTLQLESKKPDGTTPVGDTSSVSTATGTRRQVSDDGNVSYFAYEGEIGVFRRANGQTTPISVIEGDSTNTPQFGTVEGVSRDGRYAVIGVYTALTADTPGTAPAPYLYRYDAVSGGLTYLAPYGGGTSAVHAVSDDTQTLYFFDGVAHLMVTHGAQTHQVADDASDAAGVTSPSGRYYAWLALDGQVHRYDADTDTNVCVSCPANGNDGSPSYLMNAGRVPGNRAPRVVIDSGLVVFSTKTQLVTADHNSSGDVYTYQNGRATLISPGDGSYTAISAELSADGKDVFFTTDQPLVGQDTNNANDMYDARVGGGFASQSPPPPPATCSRSECAELNSGPASTAPTPSATTSPASPPARTNQEKVKVSIGKVSFGSKTVRITFTVSQKGRIRVSGDRVATTIRNVSKAGTYSVTARLSKKARAMQAAHRKFKVSLRLSLAGGWGTASAKYSRTLGK